MAVNRKVYVWCVIILFLLGIVALALWLDLRHQAPSFTIIDVSVPTPTSSPQHNNIHISFDVKNPNNAYSITYDYSVLTIKFAQHTLGQTDVIINYQPKNKETQVTSQVIADGHQQEALAKAISRSSSGEATLMVELKTGIRYHNMGRTSKQYSFKYQGRFKIGSNGKLLGKKKIKLVKGHKKSKHFYHH